MLRPVVRAAITLFLLSQLVGAVSFANWVTLTLTAIVFTLLDFALKPILKILLLPINVITLGMFSGLINAAILWLTAYMVPGFIISNIRLLGTDLNQFWTYVVISILLGFIHSISKILL